MTLLNSVSISLLQEGYQIGLDWLGQCVRAIIESVGIIGVGIICFTLILKAITLPFDVYQRVKTRKQTLIMRNMRDDLDKLQKQYANDKTMYNQKMMELYKKNGYSVFGACLPMNHLSRRRHCRVPGIQRLFPLCEPQFLCGDVGRL